MPVAQLVPRRPQVRQERTRPLVDRAAHLLRAEPIGLGVLAHQFLARADPVQDHLVGGVVGAVIVVQIRHRLKTLKTRPPTVPALARPAGLLDHLLNTHGQHPDLPSPALGNHMEHADAKPHRHR